MVLSASIFTTLRTVLLSPFKLTCLIIILLTTLVNDYLTIRSSSVVYSSRVFFHDKYFLAMNYRLIYNF